MPWRMRALSTLNEGGAALAARWHGIPALLKDNFDTMDMPTTGGARALSGIVPKADALQVKKLRQAGSGS